MSTRSVGKRRRTLRVGTWNVGSLTGKSLELVGELKRRKINIACLQETKWVESKAKYIDGHKLWYSGQVKGKNGVGIVLDSDLAKEVVDVKRRSDRIVVVKLLIEGKPFNVVSAYAPQVGLPA